LSPEQFLAKIAKQAPAPAYLFVGQEGYQRKVCREALLAKVLASEAREEGFTQVDLDERSLNEVLDDARSLSLFASERMIWIGSAELALPRRMTTAATEETDEDGKPLESALAAYLKSPTPGTVLVFECSRYDFVGDDKARLERVEKFYAGIGENAKVEFRHFTPETSRHLAQDLARKAGLKIAGVELAALLEAVAGDAGRLASEIEKLALFVGSDRPVTLEDLRALVPNAAQATIFALVSALGKRDRKTALRSLDILVRDGEYLPLALTFLGTQFRLALAAKEARISNAQQAQSYFQRIGVRIWRDRAEQVMATASAFPRESLSRAVELFYDTDKKFREGYKDDQLIMELLVLALTV
jgi:DNA polymerase-3 subunit delta